MTEDEEHVHLSVRINGGEPEDPQKFFVEDALQSDSPPVELPEIEVPDITAL